MHNFFVEPILKNLSNLGKVKIHGDTTPVKEENLYYFKSKAREIVCIEYNSLYAVKKILPNRLVIPEAGSWCEGPDSNIIFCGGCKSTGFSKEVYLIDPITMNFKVLPNMNYPRALAAVAYLDNCIYVFGGYAGSNINTCEKFDFANNKWEELPKMQVARSAFNIAIQGKILYMSGDSDRLDAFDTEKNEYIKVNIPVPQASYSTLVSLYKDLILLQNDSAFEVNLTTSRTRRLSTIPQGKWWSSFVPHIKGNLIYLARYDDGFLWTFDTTNNSISKRYKLIS